jgi:transketolase
MRNAALKTVENMVRSSDRVCFIGSDLGFGTLQNLRDSHPDRVLMEGIAEQQIIGFSAGLSASGYFPIVHTIATFLTRRSFEQIAMDFSLQNLSGMLLGAGGGMVYAPLGPTHQAIDDFALMSTIPNLKVYAPADPIEIENLMLLSFERNELSYFRIGRGGEPNITTKFEIIGNGTVKYKRNGDDFTLITNGTLLHEALEAFTALAESGLKGLLIHIPLLNHESDKELRNLIAGTKNTFVFEEHIPIGGLFSHLTNGLFKFNHSPTPLHFSLPHQYAKNYGSQSAHRALNNIDAAGIYRTVKGALTNAG